MKRFWIILLLLVGAAAAKQRPPVLDPNVCPYPYDVNVVTVAAPMSWVAADVNISVASQVNVWNWTGREVVITVEQVVLDPNGPTVVPIQHTLLEQSTSPVPDPNGGYNQPFSWSITPTEGRIYYLLFTASTPSKPHWRGDQRIILVYAEAEDVPVLWVQDIPLISAQQAQRLWVHSQKVGPPMTSPTYRR